MVLNARRRPLVMDGASGIDLLHYEISPTNNRNPSDLQVAVHAELVGSNRCHAEGFTAHGAAPVLALCRKLIEAGFDPARPLCAYRGDVLCLKVRTIAEGAALTVDDSGPRFSPWKAFCRAAVSAPMRQNRSAGVEARPPSLARMGA